MDISKDECELYDRQIRLWGLGGQTRLRSARILVLGFEAVAVEVAKNLVLAGVGALTLQSSRDVTPDDLGFNFFVKAEQIGKNVAEASKVAVQRLNPRVSVTSETQPLNELDNSYYAQFDVVIISQTENLEQLERIDECVRQHGAFYYCTLRGWAGMVLVDLGAAPHTFSVEKEVGDVTTKIGKMKEYQEIVEVQPPVDGNIEKLTVKDEFVSLKSVMRTSTNFGGTMKVRHRKKVSLYLPAFLACLDGTTPTEKAEQLGLPGLITPEFEELFTRGKDVQLSAVAAVVGGVLSQEVLNFLTRQEYPIHNTFVYDALEGQGPVYYLRPE